MGLIRLSKKITKSSNNTGDFGEMIVSSIFDNRFFDNDEHYLINNLYIIINDKSYQLDHVLIYSRGIFVIETKNIKGKIIGDYDSPKWVVINHNRKYYINNPIKQNHIHEVALNELLEYKYPIIPITVFIHSNKPSNIDNSIVNLEELKDYIKSYTNEMSLDSNTMQDIYTFLTTYKEQHSISRSEHIKNINK